MDDNEMRLEALILAIKQESYNLDRYKAKTVLALAKDFYKFLGGRNIDE